MKPICRYSEWTPWGRCSVTCGNGVQTRARNQISGNICNDTKMDYRMCQLQPCMCILTKEFYSSATGQKVPANSKYFSIIYILLLKIHIFILKMLLAI